MKDQIRTLARELSTMAFRHEGREVKRLATLPPQKAWERLTELHRRALANPQLRPAYREALLCVIVYLEMVPGDERATLFRSMLDFTRESRSFEGLESVFLSVIEQLGREGYNELVERGASMWTKFGAPTRLGGGEKASLVFDFENGTFSNVGREGLDSLGFQRQRGHMQITTGAETVSSLLTVLEYVVPAIVVVTIVVVILVEKAQAPRPEPKPEPPDAGTPDPMSDSDLGVPTRQMEAKIAKFLKSWRGPSSDPPAHGEGQLKDARGVRLSIADIIGGGHTDPSPEGDSDEGFRRAAKTVALEILRYKWVSDESGWGGEGGSGVPVSIGGGSLFEQG